MTWKLKDLIEHAATTSTHTKEEGWVPARPIGHKHASLRERFKAAWQVFTGKADSFVWPAKQ